MLALEAASVFCVDRLLERAEAERIRREAAGISCSVEVRQPPRPAFDTQLVGKRLEICWPYKKDGKTCKVWASGTVKRVADGLTNKRSVRCKSILPAGAPLWPGGMRIQPDYDEAAGEQWMVLHPDKYNKHVQYASCDLIRVSWCRRGAGSRRRGRPWWKDTRRISRMMS